MHIGKFLMDCMGGQIPSSGSAKRKGCNCIKCGVSLDDVHGVDFKFGAGFTDKSSLASSPNGCYECVGCYGMSKVMQDNLKVADMKHLMFPEGHCKLAGGDGDDRINNMGHAVWLALHNQRSDFVVLYSQSKLQHLVWKAKVSLDPANFWVQFGNKRHLVSRSMLVDLIAANERLNAALLEETGKERLSNRCWNETPFNYALGKQFEKHATEAEKALFAQANGSTYFFLGVCVDGFEAVEPKLKPYLINMV